MKLNRICLSTVLVSLALSVLGCGASDGGEGEGAFSATDFPEGILTDYASWTSVMNSGSVFASRGHAGQYVKVLFDQTARGTFEAYAKDSATVIFAETSIVAKAVFSSAAPPASELPSKVYFMRKKAEGFDDTNNNWAYAEAYDRAGTGQLKFEGSSGALGKCVNCHSAEKAYDFVRTLKYYKNQAVD